VTQKMRTCGRWIANRELSSGTCVFIRGTGAPIFGPRLSARNAFSAGVCCDLVFWLIFGAGDIGSGVPAVPSESAISSLALNLVVRGVLVDLGADLVSSFWRIGDGRGWS
jgi:hypothetical protein